MSRLATAITNYQANNNGKLPKDQTAVNGFVANYVSTNLGDDFADPALGDYYVKFEDASSGAGFSSSGKKYGDLGTNGEEAIIYFVVHAMCDGDEVKTANGKRDYAIFYPLENGGSYCQDSGGSAKSSTSGSGGSTTTTTPGSGSGSGSTSGSGSGSTATP